MKRGVILLLAGLLTACTSTQFPSTTPPRETVQLTRMAAADLAPGCALTARLTGPRVEFRLSATCPDDYAVRVELTDGVFSSAVGFHGGAGAGSVLLPTVPGWYAAQVADVPTYFLHVP